MGQFERGNGFSANKNLYNGDYPNELDPDEIDLIKLFSIILRYKWIIAGITLMFTIASVIYSYSIIPVYESDGTILIKDDQNRYPGGGAELSNLLSATYGIGMGSTLSNELQVFRSRSMSFTLANRVIQEDVMKNGSRFPILWRAFPDDSTVVTRDSVATRIRNNMDIVRQDQDTDMLRITFKSYSPLEAAWMVDQAIEGYTDLSQQQNRGAASSALDFLERERELIREELNENEQRLRVYMNETGLIQVDEQTSAAIERISELEAQRQELQVRKVAVTSAISAYEQQLDEIKPGLADQFSDNVGTTLERYQYRLAELETEKLLLLQRNPSLRDQPDQEPYLVEIEDQIQLLRSEINRIASTLVDESADAYIGFLSNTDNGIAGRITDLRTQLIELRIEESQYLAQETAIDERMAAENEFFNNLPDNMIELARLKRDAEIQEELFLTISQQYAETALWEQTQFGQGRPLDYAFVPDKPTEPKKRMIVIVGFLLGGIVSLGAVFTRELFNNTLDSVDHLKERGYPLLTVIPDMTNRMKEIFGDSKTVTIQGKSISTSLLSITDSISPVSESFRRLHNNIIYSHPDENFKRILITSSAKGEGKSTVSTNLAVILAESGKKVLIIDSDLRRPNLHKLLGENRIPGLIDTLFNDDIELSQVIRETVVPNLDLLTTGQEPPNPSAVLQSEKLKGLIDQVEEHYDHIIIDTAPYGIITDAAPLIPIVDGVVLIARFGETPINELNQSIENLERVHAKIIGTVLTAYNYEKSGDYYTRSNGHYDYQRAYKDYNRSI